jgi:hypothetical protein
MKEVTNLNTDFEQILQLIIEARGRVYAKANAELVLLYFNVGKIVSQKVEAGKWGESTVQELANFIILKQPELSGFNRRGLYRMKQFYEIYRLESKCFEFYLSLNDKNVTPLATQLQDIENEINIKVSPIATLLEMHINFLNNILLKLSWTNHLEIFSSCKNVEEIIFYTLTSLKEKWSKTELRRQIKTATFERTMISKTHNNTTSKVLLNLPQNLFKDPYIFEFLVLPESHSEKDFEKAIVIPSIFIK